LIDERAYHRLRAGPLHVRGADRLHYVLEHRRRTKEPPEALCRGPPPTTRFEAQRVEFREILVEAEHAPDGAANRGLLRGGQSPSMCYLHPDLSPRWRSGPEDRQVEHPVWTDALRPGEAGPRRVPSIRVKDGPAVGVGRAHEVEWIRRAGGELGDSQVACLRLQ